MNIRNLIRTYTINSYKIDGEYAKFAKKLGLNESDLCLFYALYPDYELSQRQICNEWQIPKSTLNTALKKFQKLGYLELVAMPNNKKELFVKLTRLGKDYAKPYITTIYEAEEMAMSRVLEKFDSKFIEATNLFAQEIAVEFNKK